MEGLLSSTARTVNTVSFCDKDGQPIRIGDEEEKADFLIVFDDSNPRKISVTSWAIRLVGRDLPQVKKNPDLYAERDAIVERAADYWYDEHNSEFLKIGQRWKPPADLIAAMWPDETSIYHDVKTNPFVMAFINSPTVRGNTLLDLFPHGMPVINRVFQDLHTDVQKFWAPIEGDMNLHQVECTANNIRSDIMGRLKEEEARVLNKFPASIEQDTVKQRLHESALPLISRSRLHGKRIRTSDPVPLRVVKDSSDSYVVKVIKMVDDQNQPIPIDKKKTDVLHYEWYEHEVKKAPFYEDNGIGIHVASIMKWLIGDQPELIDRAVEWSKANLYDNEWITFSPTADFICDGLLSFMWGDDNPTFGLCSSNPYYLNFKNHPIIKGNYMSVFFPDGLNLGVRDNEAIECLFATYGQEWVHHLDLHQIEQTIIKFNRKIQAESDEMIHNFMRYADAPIAQKNEAVERIKAARYN